jgi:hypothetical protein
VTKNAKKSGANKMTEQKVYQITKPEYQFVQTPFSAHEGYLIVGSKDDKAVINHFSEHVMTHEAAMKWYERQNIPVVRVYTGGEILKIAQLKDRLNQKSIKEVLGDLEKELLK